MSEFHYSGDSARDIQFSLNISDWTIQSVAPSITLKGLHAATGSTEPVLAIMERQGVVEQVLLTTEGSFEVPDFGSSFVGTCR